MKIQPSTTLLLSVALGILLFAVNKFNPFEPAIFLGLAGFIGLFGMITWFFSKAMFNAKSGKIWINQFLASIAIKMFATLSYLTIYLYTHKDWDTQQKLQLAIGAFFIYISFTVLLATIKPKSE